ncbi:MAG: DsbA family protein [Candidatus Scalindua sp.]
MKIKSYNLLNTLIKHSLRTFLLLIIAIYVFEVLPVTQAIYPECEAEEEETTTANQNEFIELADEILANRKCPCQCGKYLPGSSNLPACFGCSAGKAEISYILESLESGKETGEIVMNLDSPIIIDVFADYTNPNIYKVWNLARTVSSDLHQRRVVLRPPGLTREAQRAIKIAEYARFRGNFSTIQEAMIKHNGPWDWRTLINLVAQYDQIPQQINVYINSIEIDQQIAKDQQHARERGIESYPTISINNIIVPDTDTAIRQTIEKILLEHSI